MEKKHIIAAGAFAVLALTVLALVPPPAGLVAPAPAPDESLLLGTYEGVTPCADCPGIRTELTLVKDSESLAEGTYRLSMTYLERDAEPYLAAGFWTTERGTKTDPDASVYTLDPDGESPMRYRVVDADTIRQLDGDGNEIDARMPFDLTRVTGNP